MGKTSWKAASEAPQKIAQGETHVWRVSLDQPTARIKAWERFLTTEELERADRFYFDRDKRRFLVSRAVLRILLGRYLEKEAESIRFYPGPFGKPYLAPNLEAASLQFNVSHSNELALIGIVKERQIGIDIEYRKPLNEIREIAVNFFSPDEVTTLLTLPSPLQPIGFFNCWSRKEAYIKAIGKGLSQPLDSFDVTLRPGEPAKLLRVADRPDEVARWSMQVIEAHHDYAAALAVEGDDWESHLFDFDRSP